MEDPSVAEEREGGKWVDFDTLVAECVERLRVKGWEPHYESWPGGLRGNVASCLARRCGSPSEIVGMAGGRIDFRPMPDSNYDVRYRVCLREGEPIVLEDLQAFLDWVRENRPELKALVERERLASAAPKPRSSQIGRASRSL